MLINNEEKINIKTKTKTQMTYTSSQIIGLHVGFPLALRFLCSCHRTLREKIRKVRRSQVEGRGKKNHLLWRI
jgi:hypothetical protein